MRDPFPCPPNQILRRIGPSEPSSRRAVQPSCGGTGLPSACRSSLPNILLFLLQHAGQIVTREDLRIQLWPADTFVDFDHALNTAVMKLREALGDSSEKPLYIQTLPRKGYRFVAPVAMLPPMSGRPGIGARVAPSLSDLSGAGTGTADNGISERGASASSEFLDSIAILPFENAGGEPDMDYLSDGITASIINIFSQVNRLRVIPRTTVFRYKGKLSDAAQAGRQLRVRVVLTGRVAQRGDALTINVELIDTAHESQLWGAHYNGGSDDIFRIQAEIAAQVTNKLKLSLNDDERKQLATRPTKSREAYYLLLKSLYWANKWTPEGMRKGVDYARQAIDIDPAYAEAWTALAYLFVLIGFFGAAQPSEMFAKAKAAAVKALDIDDRESDAHATLAYVRLVYDWDWQGAHQELLRAIELGPNLANGHWVYSHWYLTQGLYAEAMREARLALNSDPLSVQFHYQVGAIFFFARQYDHAIEQLHATIELDPLFVPGHQLLAASYAGKGMRRDAMVEIDKGSELAKNDVRSKALLGIVRAMAGELVETRKLLGQLRQELRPPNFSFAYHCAALHSLLGEIGDAFTCLDMARQGRSVQLAYIAIAQELEILRGDPRFREMLLNMGFPLGESANLSQVFSERSCQGNLTAAEN